MRSIGRAVIGTVKSFGKTKVFGIGNNKTGTTSLKKAMIDLGYTVGHQPTAEDMIDLWAKRKFKKIIRYCRTAEFFQDVPFSKPYTFVVLDHEFPKSKFILTIRDSPDQWYNSLTNFHGKLWGKDGRIPTKEDLQNATYRYKGSPWDTNRLSYLTPEDNPYEKRTLLKAYKQYNNSVLEYFRHRQEDLLVLNVAEKGAYKKLCDFLGKPCDKEDFPWENKTASIQLPSSKY